jgi:hypothetical protein
MLTVSLWHGSGPIPWEHLQRNQHDQVKDYFTWLCTGYYRQWSYSYILYQCTLNYTSSYGLLTLRVIVVYAPRVNPHQTHCQQIWDSPLMNCYFRWGHDIEVPMPKDARAQEWSFPIKHLQATLTKIQYCTYTEYYPLREHKTLKAGTGESAAGFHWPELRSRVK